MESISNLSKELQEKNSTQYNLVDVIEYNSRSNINEYKLFIIFFKIIPNNAHERNIDCKKANKWLLENYNSEIKETFFSKGYLNEGKHPEVDDIHHFLFEDLIISLDTKGSFVRFLFRNTPIETVDKIIAGFRKFKTKFEKNKPKISLVLNTSEGLETKTMTIKKQKININENYNDDFLPVHQTIIKRLNKQNDKGLVLLHGKPGTGKTSYIRYLVAILKKKVIFLPPNLAGNVTNPDLISILIKNPNSVLVIEDAENIVIDRERNGESPVSTLLNISDGLLSDCLNIQLICSFNTDITKVDKALMRKGRMIAKYEFKELEVHKAQLLSDKLKFKRIISKPMTLTDIYNQMDENYSNHTERTPIGFRVHNIA